MAIFRQQDREADSELLRSCRGVAPGVSSVASVLFGAQGLHGIHTGCSSRWNVGRP
jgi:hypothetical protein